MEKGKNRPSSDGARRTGRPPRILNVHSLSSEQWCYIYGIYLADGYLLIRFSSEKGYTYHVRFKLQGNEGEIVHRISEMLRKAGLNPYTHKLSTKDEIDVDVRSKALFTLLPNKKNLEGNMNKWIEFCQQNRLFTIDRGIPFLAGMLDGDGSCRLKISKRHIDQWTWNFCQTRLPFLVHYIVEFVESIAPKSVNSSVRVRNNHVEWRIHFRKLAILTLLNLGISKYSWKVTEWEKNVTAWKAILEERKRDAKLLREYAWYSRHIRKRFDGKRREI